MYTAIVVYQAPQMKNCKNIIVDSLARTVMVVSARFHGERFRYRHDDMCAGRKHNVRVLARLRHPGADGPANDTADNRAALVAADHAAENRAGHGAAAHLGRVTGRDAAPLVH